MRFSRITLITAILALAPVSAYALPTMFQHANTMSVSPDIPAAQGTVKFGKSDNGNTTISMVVKYLAEPEKLVPPAATYVVWAHADKDAAPQNIGSLAVDKHRKGSLKTVTPFHSFRLFVTAEPNGQIQAPTGQRLLWIERNSD